MGWMGHREAVGKWVLPCQTRVLHSRVHSSGLPLWPTLPIPGSPARPMSKEGFLSQLTDVGSPARHTRSSCLAPDSISSQTCLPTPSHLTAYPSSGWWLARRVNELSN